MADGFDFNGPASIVKDKYEKSLEFSHAAERKVNNFMEALGKTLYSPPVIDVHWTTLAAPTLPDVPAAPKQQNIVLTLPADQPQTFNETMPTVAFSDFNEPAPAMNFPVAPDIVIGTAPSVPGIRDVAIPEAPDVQLPDAPAFLQLQTHTFGGVNLHEDWLNKLDDIPQLSVLEPTPFKYERGPAYASQLLDSLKAALNARIHGGTGLSPAVEQAIWDRARDRETQVALAREREVMRGVEALGYPLPSGVLVGQLADARREYHDKLSTLSRDVAIKQAELEQENVKSAIQSAIQLEGQLMDQAYKLEMLMFEAAKTAAQMSLEVYNGAIRKYQALLAGYQAYAAAYDTLIKAEMNKVEVFKAMLQAEQVKASINESLVQRYKAEIEGRMAGVEIYKARVGAAQTLVELERTRIQAGGEQIRAFVAQVNAETAKVEIYKAQIGAETAKQDAYGRRVQAYSAKVGAQAEQSRALLGQFDGRLKAKALEWDAWKARLSGKVAEMDAVVKQASIQWEGYKIGAVALEAKAGSLMQRWSAEIKQYEASQNVMFQAQKINTDNWIHSRDVRVDAAKVGVATSAQQLASAWTMVSAQASISAGGSDNISRQA